MPVGERKDTKKGAHGNTGGWMEGERCAGGGVVEQMDGEG